MHPNLTQALITERIGNWRDQAARDRLAKQARRARREAKLPPAELPAIAVPEPRSGSRPAAGTSVGSAAGEPVAVASGPAASEDRHPAGGRAA